MNQPVFQIVNIESSSYVARCRPLGLTAYGNSEEEACKELKKMFSVWVDVNVRSLNKSIDDIPRNKDNCPHEAEVIVHWLGRTCHKCVYGRGTPCSYPVHKDKET